MKTPFNARRRIAKKSIEKLIKQGYSPKDAARIAFKQAGIPYNPHRRRKSK